MENTSIFRIFRNAARTSRRRAKSLFPNRYLMLIDDIALTMHPEAGCRTVAHLLEYFGSAENVYAAQEEELREGAGLKASLARSIRLREGHVRAQTELGFVARSRLRVITSDSEHYPRRLLECGDYPHVLYVSGEMDLNAGRWLSVVGTRKITSYGARLCEVLIGELARLVPDLVIVSGLAYGVDVAAHRAAMNHGVPTVGVLGHPINRIYPPPHTDTARRMVNLGGAVLSEFSSSEEPRRSGFVQRNRIIAGLSEGTLVVESAAKGGSLITADMTDGYHRTLMAVPGRVGDLCSEGTNHLIRTLKAQMVCSGEQIAELMNWDDTTVRDPQPGLFDEPEGLPQTPPEKEAATAGSMPPVIRTEASSDADQPGETPEALDKPPVVGVGGGISGALALSVSPSGDPHSGEGTAAMRMPAADAFDEMEAMRAELERLLAKLDGPKPEEVCKYPTRNPLATDPRTNLSAGAARLLEMIGTQEPVSMDELSAKVPFPAADLALLLLDLEFSGLICSLPGNRYLKY